MIFTTPRLIARRFAPADVASLAALRDDPEVARYQSWERYSRADAEQLIGEMAGIDPGAPGWFQFALVDKAAGELIGDCGLFTHEADTRLGRIGYTIARAKWNRGLATETVVALANFAFARLRMHRLTASVDPRNIASCRVLEKAGFIKEAHFRQSDWFKGQWADDAIYARLG